MVTNPKWTVMVYMMGDNNLSSFVGKNVEEIEKVGSTPNVNVVGQYDKEGNDDTRRFFFKNGKIEEKPLNETDCCDPAVLKKFIKWAVRSHTADHYALVLYGHGWGWEPSKIDPHGGTNKPSRGTSREAHHRGKAHYRKQLFRTTRETNSQTREAFFVIDFGETNRSEYVRTRGMGPDKNGHSLDTLELDKVVAYAKRVIGKKLDILGLDGCLMSNLEVAYQIYPFVNYLIASEEKAPLSAWPYDKVLNVFNNKAEDSPGNISMGVVKEYINFFKEMKKKVNATQSAFALEKIEETAKKVDALGEKLVKHMPDAAKEITTALEKSESKSFYLKRLWDINEFAMEISKTTSDSEIEDAAREVQTAIEHGIDKFVLGKSETGPKCDATWGGLSVYLFYPNREKVSKYYKDLKFTKKHPNWHKMLKSISLKG